MKTRRLVIVFLLFLHVLDINAQTVINTEALRLEADTQRVRGILRADFGMSRNKAGRFLRPGLSTRIELQSGSNRYMLLGGYSMTEFTDLEEDGQPKKLFNNQGFVHLRYNRPLEEWLTWEVFSQYQFDFIQEIDRRILFGTGPRWQLADQETYFAFLGSLYMYEYEETSAEEAIIIVNKHHRLSNYLSAGHTFNEHVRGSLTAYFQPRVDVWSDYRLSMVCQIQIQLAGYIGLTLTGNYVYDANPPVTVPEAMYDFRTGLSINW